MEGVVPWLFGSLDASTAAETPMFGGRHTISPDAMIIQKVISEVVDVKLSFKLGVKRKTAVVIMVNLCLRLSGLCLELGLRLNRRSRRIARILCISSNPARSLSQNIQGIEIVLSVGCEWSINGASFCCLCSICCGFHV